MLDMYCVESLPKLKSLLTLGLCKNGSVAGIPLPSNTWNVTIPNDHARVP